MQKIYIKLQMKALILAIFIAGSLSVNQKHIHETVHGHSALVEQHHGHLYHEQIHGPLTHEDHGHFYHEDPHYLAGHFQQHGVDTTHHLEHGHTQAHHDLVHHDVVHHQEPHCSHAPVVVQNQVGGPAPQKESHEEAKPPPCPKTAVPCQNQNKDVTPHEPVKDMKHPTSASPPPAKKNAGYFWHNARKRVYAKSLKSKKVDSIDPSGIEFIPESLKLRDVKELGDSSYDDKYQLLTPATYQKIQIQKQKDTDSIYYIALYTLCDNNDTPIYFIYDTTTKVITYTGLPEVGPGCTSNQLSVDSYSFSTILNSQFKDSFVKDAETIEGGLKTLRLIDPIGVKDDEAQHPKDDLDFFLLRTISNRQKLTLEEVKDKDLQELMEDNSLYPIIDLMKDQTNSKYHFFISGICQDAADTPVRVEVAIDQTLQTRTYVTSYPATCQNSSGGSNDKLERYKLFEYIARTLNDVDLTIFDTESYLESGKIETEDRTLSLVPYFKEEGTPDDDLVEGIDYTKKKEYNVEKINGGPIPLFSEPKIVVYEIVPEVSVVKPITKEFTATISGFCIGDANNVQVNFKLYANDFDRTHTVIPRSPTHYCADETKEKALITIIDSLLLGKFDFFDKTDDVLTTGGGGRQITLRLGENLSNDIEVVTSPIQDFTPVTKEYEFTLYKVKSEALNKVIQASPLSKPIVKVFQLHADGSNDIHYGGEISQVNGCGAIKFELKKESGAFVKSRDKITIDVTTCTEDQGKLIVYAIETLLTAAFDGIEDEFPKVSYLDSHEVELTPTIEATTDTLPVTPAESATIKYKHIDYEAESVTDSTLTNIIGTDTITDDNSNSAKKVTPTLRVTRVTDTTDSANPAVKSYFIEISGICDTETRVQIDLVSGKVTTRKHTTLPDDDNCKTGISGDDDWIDEQVQKRKVLLLDIIETLAWPEDASSFDFLDSTEKKSISKANDKELSLVPVIDEEGDLETFDDDDIQEKKYFKVKSIGENGPVGESDYLAILEVDLLKNDKHQDSDSTKEYFVKVIAVCDVVDQVVQVSYKVQDGGDERSHTTIDEDDFCPEETDSDVKDFKRKAVDEIIRSVALDNVDFSSSSDDSIKAQGWNSEEMILEPTEDPYPPIKQLNAALVIDPADIEKTISFSFDEVLKGVKETDLQATILPLIQGANPPILHVYKLKGEKDYSGNQVNEEVAWAAKIENLCTPGTTGDIILRYLEEPDLQVREYSFTTTGCDDLAHYVVDTLLWDKFDFMSKDNEDPKGYGQEIYINPTFTPLNTALVVDDPTKILKEVELEVDKLELKSVNDYNDKLTTPTVVKVRELEATAPNKDYSFTVDVTCSDGTVKSNKVIQTVKEEEVLSREIYTLQKCDANDEEEKDYLIYVLETLSYSDLKILEDSLVSGVEVEGYGKKIELSLFIKITGVNQYVARLATTAKDYYQITEFDGVKASEEIKEFFEGHDDGLIVEVSTIEEEYWSKFGSVDEGEFGKITLMKVAKVRGVIPGEDNEGMAVFIQAEKGEVKSHTAIPDTYPVGSVERQVIDITLKTLLYSSFEITASPVQMFSARGFEIHIAPLGVQTITESSISKEWYGPHRSQFEEYNYNLVDIKHPQLKATFQSYQDLQLFIFNSKTDSNKFGIQIGKLLEFTSCSGYYATLTKQDDGTFTAVQKTIERDEGKCSFDKLNMLSYIIDVVVFDHLNFLTTHRNPSNYGYEIEIEEKFTILTEEYIPSFVNNQVQDFETNFEKMYELELYNYDYGSPMSNYPTAYYYLRDRNLAMTIRMYKMVPPDGYQYKYVTTISNICQNKYVQIITQLKTGETHVERTQSKFTGAGCYQYNYNGPTAYNPAVRLNDYLARTIAFNDYSFMDSPMSGIYTLYTGDRFVELKHVLQKVNEKSNLLMEPAYEDVSRLETQSERFPLYEMDFSSASNTISSFSSFRNFEIIKITSPTEADVINEFFINFEDICFYYPVQLRIVQTSKTVKFTLSKLHDSKDSRCSYGDILSIRNAAEAMTLIPIADWNDLVESWAELTMNHGSGTSISLSFVEFEKPPTLEEKTQFYDYLASFKAIPGKTYSVRNIRERMRKPDYPDLLNFEPLIRASVSTQGACANGPVATEIKQVFMVEVLRIMEEPFQAVMELMCDDSKKAQMDPGPSSDEKVNTLLKYIASAGLFNRLDFGPISIGPFGEFLSDGIMKIGPRGNRLEIYPQDFHGTEAFSIPSIMKKIPGPYFFTKYYISLIEHQRYAPYQSFRESSSSFSKHEGEYLDSSFYRFNVKNYEEGTEFQDPVAQNYIPYRRLDLFHPIQTSDMTSVVNVRRGFYGFKNGFPYFRKEAHFTQLGDGPANYNPTISELGRSDSHLTFNEILITKLTYKILMKVDKPYLMFEPRIRNTNIVNYEHYYNKAQTSPTKHSSHKLRVLTATAKSYANRGEPNPNLIEKIEYVNLEQFQKDGVIFISASAFIADCSEENNPKSLLTMFMRFTINQEDGSENERRFYLVGSRIKECLVDIQPVEVLKAIVFSETQNRFEQYIQGANGEFALDGQHFLFEGFGYRVTAEEF